MNQEKTCEETRPYVIKQLHCRRRDVWVAPAEHQECRYCFGSRTEVERGIYKTFCDYRPGVDPPGAELPSELERWSSG